MATLLKVLNNRADIKSAGGVALRVRTQADGRPLILLLHGFPELAYSWRKVMTPLAGAGYYVVAPDQRGYGLTTGWDDRFNGDLQSFTISRIAIDAFALVRALGMKAVHTVVGHDFGSPIAAWCGLTRPDFFRSCVMMSAPYRLSLIHI